jgi:hypothetical protein
MGEGGISRNFVLKPAREESQVTTERMRRWVGQSESRWERGMVKRRVERSAGRETAIENMTVIGGTLTRTSKAIRRVRVEDGRGYEVIGV